MNYDEEIAMEMEALGAIFGDQFEQSSSKSCSILAVPNADEAHVSCYLDWTLPDNYPDSPPGLQVRNNKGLNDKWLQELQSKLTNAASDMTGAPMIFNLVEMSREWLTERNIAGLADDSMHSKMLVRELEKQREKEQAVAEEKAKISNSKKDNKKNKDIGTPVTLETYTKWMNLIIQEHQTIQSQNQNKLTGRQLFERGSFKAEDEEPIVASEREEEFDRELIEEEEVDLEALSSEEEYEPDDAGE